MKFAVTTSSSTKTESWFLEYFFHAFIFQSLYREPLPENFLINIGNKSEVGEKVVICKALLIYANSKLPLRNLQSD